MIIRRDVYAYYGLIVDGRQTAAPGRPIRRSSRFGWLAFWGIAATTILVLMAALGWGLVHATRQSISIVGAQVPDLTIQSFDGDRISLRQLVGTPMVVNFWASWCVPCRREAPILAAVARQSTGRAYFIGVDIQDTDAAARAYDAEIKSPYPVGPAVRGSYRDFGVTAPPETFFVDRTGTVVSRIIGPVDSRRMQIYMSQILG